MSDKKSTIKALNSLLQGEYMGIDAFNVFISKTKMAPVKSTLQEVQKHHRDNVDALATYIQNLGGKPDENLGLKGFMADMKLSMEMSSELGYSPILEKAIEGMENGINMTEKVVRGKLDDETRNFIGDILHQDRQSLRTLEGLRDDFIKQ